ncbi:MAG: AAA family ATPase [Saprospiraceae bacterium]
MLTKLEIENFKSIHKESIDLSRVNVFIGENGCGKTNILEALGMVSALQANKLDNDELALKGIRVTKPSITISSFLRQRTSSQIGIKIFFEGIAEKFLLTPEDINDIYSKWKKYISKTFMELAIEISSKNVNSQSTIVGQAIKLHDLGKSSRRFQFFLFLNDYKIYNLSTKILRGIGGISHAIPGINGENLDYLINSFSKEEMEELEHHASMISWLDKIIIDQDDSLKLQGHKLNLSQSKLYFRDKFMQKKNNVFSAENANEGILHILFYIALFISKKTPKLFAIDNIETALNPGLCRSLIEILVKLAKKHDKQVLITTHNPAILDGINLHDDEQRIFTVARNFKGHTKVKRLQIKPDKEVGGHRLKLSELWMRNYLGAIPQHY